jgi:tRNA threonylcarbamoyladenosine biosynthesis protein TsaE
MHHLDVYRLDRLQEADDLGLAELVDDQEGVTLIEWGDAVTPVLPRDYLEVRLTFGPGDDDRDLQLAVVGRSWAPRTDALAAALEAWAC